MQLVLPMSKFLVKAENYYLRYQKIKDSKKPLHLLEKNIFRRARYHACEARELTERRKTDEIRARIAEMGSYDEKIVRTFCHDFRNVLQKISGLTRLIEEKIEKGEPMPKNILSGDIGNIKNGIVSMDAIISCLVEWATEQKIEPKKKKFVLLELINLTVGTERGMAEKKCVALNIAIREELVVFADFRMAERTLVNLVGNAIKFTNKGGEVSVSAEKVADFAKIIVKDNGVGIENNDMQRLFDPEWSITHKGTDGEKGTGFGLKIAREFVEKNGGTVSVKSEIGKGTEVSFTLPLAKEASNV